MDPLFPALPENLAELSDEQLAEALEARLATVAAVEEENADVLGDRSAETVITELTAGVEQIEAIRAEQTSRVEAAEEYVGTVAELAARVRPAEMSADEAAETGEEAAEEAAEGAEEAAEEAGESAEEAEESAESAEESADDADESAGEASTEPVAASARRERPRLARPPRAARSRQPVPAEAVGASLVASSGIRGIAPGTPLDRDGIAQALLEAHRLTSARDVTERVIVASARFDYPEDRQLGDNPALNTERIAAVTGEQALVASGGLCAPVTPLYDLPILSVPDRPVRAALAGFQATRGGISYPTPLGLADVEDGVGVVTAENDELGGTFATKNCVVIDCEPYTDAVIEAIYACIQHGNFGARTWPERVANLADLLAAQHAKVAEIELLDALSDGSTAVTDEAKYGATSTLLQGILKAAAGLRSRNRMRPETRLRAILPAWSIDLLVADMAHQPYDRFERSRSGVEALLSEIGGVSASFYLDGPTGGAQIWGAQTAGALLEFPTTVIWYLFPEGTWLFLDGGELDLGLVRDSVLNSQNDFQIFMETFEGAAMVGIESLEVTSTVCPNGAYPAGSTAFTC